jgi:predicted Zn-dependent protease
MKRLSLLAGVTGKALGIALALGFVMISCQSVSDAVGVTAKGAGDAGYISGDLANAGVRFSEDMDNAQDDFTPEQEYYIGRAVAAQILARYPIDNSKAAQTEYLNKILQALVVHSPKPEIYNGYHAAILDSDELNAFATSGGHIFVSRALFSCATTEDALAAVLAHETAHIYLRHNIKAIQAARKTRAITTLAAAALDELVANFSEVAADGVVALLNKGYSRNQEFEADITALAILAATGYDPSSLPDMLRALDRDQPSHSGGFNATHPSPKERLNNVNRKLGAYSVPDTRSFRRARFSTAIK